MPCNMIATVRTKLAVDTGLIIATDAALNATRNMIAQAAGVQAEAVEMRKYIDCVTFSWGDYPNPTSVGIFKNGDINVSHRNRSTAVLLKDKLAPALTMLAGTLNQYRVRSAIAAQFQITEEQRLPTGALVMTVEF